MTSQQTSYAPADTTCRAGPASYPAPYGYGYAEPPPAAAPDSGAPGSAPPPSPETSPAAPPTGTLIPYVEEFNTIVKKMTCELVVRYPTDATINRAKKRILLAMDMAPIFIIDAVGPYLYHYREGIYAGDADFFIENDYDAELKESVNAEKADLVSYIIPKVKEAWKVSDAGQREAYKATVQALLDIYLEYLALQLAQDGQ